MCPGRSPLMSHHRTYIRRIFGRSCKQMSSPHKSRTLPLCRTPRPRNLTRHESATEHRERWAISSSSGYSVEFDLTYAPSWSTQRLPAASCCATAKFSTITTEINLTRERSRVACRLRRDSVRADIPSLRDLQGPTTSGEGLRSCLCKQGLLIRCT